MGVGLTAEEAADISDEVVHVTGLVDDGLYADGSRSFSDAGSG